ncbi:phage baseplate assembly protein V [Actinobacillus suis]|uniref:phage baseplate assembly protein V n=1 Tax=Actinobacillus suis TaxID=716 RepID=UPI000E317471|nr:phage baseplate assembly protein V [Actinobacillus suis]
MQTHNFGATYQEGIVSAVDPKTHKVRCKIPALEDLETAWLSVLTPNAGGNQFYCLPDKGELVALLLDARGEGGCVLGAIYNEQDPTPVADSEMWLHKFSNGTEISHNRKTGDVVVNTSGKVIVTASSATINADTTVKGKLHATGKITSGEEVSAPSVKQGAISLGSHVHGGVESGNKKSGTPQ